MFVAGGNPTLPSSSARTPRQSMNCMADPRPYMTGRAGRATCVNRSRPRRPRQRGAKPSRPSHIVRRPKVFQAWPGDRSPDLDALRAIRLPQGGDIVAPRMVTGLVLRDGHVGFAIEVDPTRRARSSSRCARRPRRPSCSCPASLSVTAVLTAHRAAPRARRTQPTGPAIAACARPFPRPCAGRPAGAAAGSRCPASSTSSPSPAARAASASPRSRSTWRWRCRATACTVGLLDADIYGPCMPLMMGISGKPTTRGRQDAAADAKLRRQADVDGLPGRPRTRR